jgi:hypothetical protein
MVQDAENPKHQLSPPYTAFASVKTLFGSLKEHGLPGRIDRSVLTNFSGAVGSQIITALRFLGLIDADNRPNPDFQTCLDAYGTDAWPQALGNMVKQAYEPIFQLDLKTASPSQFTEKFRGTYPNKEETLRKCLTFFLNAAREAELPISAYIMKNKKPRSSNGPRKPKVVRTAKVDNENAGTGANNSGTGTNTSGAGDAIADALTAFKGQLLDKFPPFDPTWPENIKADWFKGFQQFLDMAKK